MEPIGRSNEWAQWTWSREDTLTRQVSPFAFPYTVTRPGYSDAPRVSEAKGNTVAWLRGKRIPREALAASRDGNRPTTPRQRPICPRIRGQCIKTVGDISGDSVSKHPENPGGA
jgi:hypothetical protein